MPATLQYLDENRIDDVLREDSLLPHELVGRTIKLGDRGGSIIFVDPHKLEEISPSFEDEYGGGGNSHHEELVGIVPTLLGALTPLQEFVVKMHFCKGKTPEQIAKSKNIPTDERFSVEDVCLCISCSLDILRGTLLEIVQ